MRCTVIIDPGHGGMIDGFYQTHPDKMFEHSPTEIFYEGVFNRLIADQLMRKLDKKGIPYINLCPSNLDIPLNERVDIANIYQKEYGNCLGISLHSNASPSHLGRGFEIHTSKGETRSDRYAHMLGEGLISRFPEIKYRKGNAPGELDKDSPFQILRWTNCPWVLPECLFFDNYQDYQLLIDPAFQEKYVDALVNFILKAELVTV